MKYWRDAPMSPSGRDFYSLCLHLPVLWRGFLIELRIKAALFLLTYNQCSQLSSRTAVPELRAKLTSTIETEDLASMNADVLELDQNGKFLIAIGQDKYCTLYKTTGYDLNGEEDEVESPSRLTLDLHQVHRIVTDHDPKDAYQKCVRLDRSGVQPIKMATGGIDGHVRIWNISELLDGREKVNVPVYKEFHLNGGEVDDLDFSHCGTTLATVSHKEVLFWNIEQEKSMVLPTPEKIGSNYKVRTLRFTTLGRNTIVFAVAYQQRQRTSKQTSFLTLWSFNRQTGNFNMINLAKIQNAVHYKRSTAFLSHSEKSLLFI
ncbi:Prolactin regulatory element-binding protein [Aphelenchoides bicaudatus]|nr:Prolactin regulatory element-binding protein [Aphelenchoides bicaudatus]